MIRLDEVAGRDARDIKRVGYFSQRWLTDMVCPMGTRIRFLGWVPYQGLGTPSFSYPPFDEGNLIGHAQGGRDRRTFFELGWRGSFHRIGSPFLEGTGGLF